MKFPISVDLGLPADAGTQKIAFIGRTGSGKSYGAGVLVENLLRANVQVVILDVVGIWYGLRLEADGKTPGFPIPVFGGLKGDIPLESTGGALMADLIVDRGISCVLDMSQFESDAAKARFAADWADRFFFRKKASPSVVHVVLEECQELIPQQIQRGEERMLHAFSRMWKLGRNFGIGGSLITQRPQEVSKKALNQTELVFAFQLTGSHERKAMKEWLSDKAFDLNLIDELPGLNPGQCYAWSPQWLKVNRKIVFGRKVTFNSSSTPEKGAKVRAQDLAPIDLAELREKMAATIERAKADDPKLLRQEIAKLKAEAAKPAPVVKPERIVVQVLSDEDRKALEDMRSRLERIFGVMAPVYTVRPSKLNLTMDQKNDLFRQTRGYAESGIPGPQRISRAAAIAADRSVKISDANTPLSKCARALLTVLAQFHPKTVSRHRVALMAGYSVNSSTFANGLSELRVNGYLEGSGDALTTNIDGSSILNNVPPLPDSNGMLDLWESKVSKCAATFLRVLRARGFDNPVDKENLAEASGYSIFSSTFSNGLSELRVLGLIESDLRGVWLANALDI